VSLQACQLLINLVSIAYVANVLEIGGGSLDDGMGAVDSSFVAGWRSVGTDLTMAILRHL
jgi:hypothetical protein